jgi:hypothetical protein
MSFNAQKLNELLPAVYRLRDAEQGGQLQAVLTAIAGQVAVLEENLDQLYDDQFIETCAQWVVPYIGDLVGTRGLHPVAPKILSGRAEVANTIAYRRRKGTAAMLEQLARDVTGWDARAVEFFQWLATTQFMNHLRPRNHYAPDLRDWELVERLNSPFDAAAHTVDVRRIATAHGRYNVPNVGIFLWRIAAQRLSRSPAVGLDAQRFLFNPLGANMPLFTRPVAEDSITHLAEPINVPMPISRRVLQQRLAEYYGAGRSIFIEGQPIENIQVCNLADFGAGWAHTPPSGKIAIDPVLGRLAFGTAPAVPPKVTFHYGFSANLGGGEYDRAGSLDTGLKPVHPVSEPATIKSGLTAMTGGGVVEITDSGRYAETLSIHVNAGARLEVRAANEHRPTIVLGTDWPVTGAAGSEVTLNGLVIVGGTLRVPAIRNQLRKLRLVHCTLVPGISLDIDGKPQQPTKASLIVEAENVTVEIDQCIVGGLQIVESSNAHITGSFVDATNPEGFAYASAEVTPGAGGPLRMEECTVRGRVHTRMLELASNSIFMSRVAAGDRSAPVRSEQKQVGCVRFCWLPAGAQVPRRFHCEPDWEIARRIDKAERASRAKNQFLMPAERDAIRADVLSWLVPAFTSLRYCDPAYGQLSDGGPVQIATGADDESEMGAFHDLFQPQRETNLRLRLEEYLRFGLEAGIFHAT